MKRILRYLACGLAATLASTSALRADQPPPPAATPAPTAAGDGPRIKFDNDVFDAGKVPAGQPLAHTFTFTNAGNQTLEVTKVNPTCGCTVVNGAWTKTVEPGKTGTIPLSVNVNQAWSGQMMKTVTVESNDKSHPGPSSISIKFVVWKPIEISQQYAFINVPPETTNDVATAIRVDNNTEEPLAIYDAQASTPAVSVQIKTNEVGKHYELLVTAKPPFKHGNNASGQITAKTSATSMPTISIGTTVNIMPILNVMPPVVALDAAPLTNVIQKSVTISYLGSTSIKVSNPLFSAKGVDVQLNESQPGRVFTATLSFPPGFDANGRNMELTLNSTSPQMPVIRVPVTQMPRPMRSVPTSKAAATPPQAGIQIR